MFVRGQWKIFNRQFKKVALKQRMGGRQTYRIKLLSPSVEIWKKCVIRGSICKVLDSVQIRGEIVADNGICKGAPVVVVTIEIKGLQKYPKEVGETCEAFGCLEPVIIKGFRGLACYRLKAEQLKMNAQECT